MIGTWLTNYAKDVDSGTYPNIDEPLALLKGEPEITDVFLSQNPDVKNKTQETINTLNTRIDQLKAIGKDVWVEVDIPQGIHGNLGIKNPYNPKIDIFSLDHLPSKLTTYMNAIYDRINDIKGISIHPNPYIGTGGHSRWIIGYSYPAILRNALALSIRITLEEMKKISSFAPKFLEAKKISFMQMIDVPFEREAFLFQGKLPEAPMLNWINEHDVKINIGRGSWVLDKDLAEHYKWYCIERDARSPLLVHKNKYDSGTYPYQYYKDYLSNANFYCGVGYNKGILRGNTKSLVDAGYKGSWFWYNTPNIEAYKEYKRNKT